MMGFRTPMEVINRDRRKRHNRDRRKQKETEGGMANPQGQLETGGPRDRTWS